MKHREWLRQATADDATNAIARKAGIVPRTFARQVDRDHIDAESIIAIAIAYGLHPVGALADTGYLEEKWAREIAPAIALREVTEDELADEVLRRMKIGVHRHGALDIPIDELVEERERKGNNGNTGESIKDTKPHAVSSFDPDHDTPFYDPETMAAYPRHEIIPPDDQFDI